MRTARIIVLEIIHLLLSVQRDALRQAARLGFYGKQANA